MNLLAAIIHIHNIKVKKKHKNIANKKPLTPPTLSTCKSSEFKQFGFTATDSSPSTHSYAH